MSTGHFIGFPAEIYAAIFSYVQQPDLVSLLTTCRAISIEAERVLYSHIVIYEMAADMFFASDVLTNLRAALVRRFDIRFWGQSGRFNERIVASMMKMRNLVTLQLLHIELIPLLRCPTLGLRTLLLDFEPERVGSVLWRGDQLFQHAIAELDTLECSLTLLRVMFGQRRIQRLKIYATTSSTFNPSTPYRSVKSLNFVVARRVLSIPLLPRWFPEVQYLRLHIRKVINDVLCGTIIECIENLPKLRALDISGSLDSIPSGLAVRLLGANESLRSFRTADHIWVRGGDEEGQEVGLRDGEEWRWVTLA